MEENFLLLFRFDNPLESSVEFMKVNNCRNFWIVTVTKFLSDLERIRHRRKRIHWSWRTKGNINITFKYTKITKSSRHIVVFVYEFPFTKSAVLTGRLKPKIEADIRIIGKTNYEQTIYLFSELSQGLAKGSQKDQWCIWRQAHWIYRHDGKQINRVAVLGLSLVL